MQPQGFSLCREQNFQPLLRVLMLQQRPSRIAWRISERIWDSLSADIVLSAPLASPSRGPLGASGVVGPDTGAGAAFGGDLSSSAATRRCMSSKSFLRLKDKSERNRRNKSRTSSLPAANRSWRRELPAD